MADFFLIRETAVVFKKIGGWLFLKLMRIIAEYIKIDTLRAS